MKRLTKAGTLLASLAFLMFTLTAPLVFADEGKLPTTIAEHEAMAKQYRDQAAQYHKVAADHRQMAEAYKKQVAMPVSKSGQKNPWLVKMENHCGAIAQDAEKLAADVEKAADYHLRRARELQGK